MHRLDRRVTRAFLPADATPVTRISRMPSGDSLRACPRVLGSEPGMALQLGQPRPIIGNHSCPVTSLAASHVASISPTNSASVIPSPWLNAAMMVTGCIGGPLRGVSFLRYHCCQKSTAPLRRASPWRLGATHWPRRLARLDLGLDDGPISGSGNSVHLRPRSSALTNSNGRKFCKTTPEGAGPP